MHVYFVFQMMYLVQVYWNKFCFVLYFEIIIFPLNITSEKRKLLLTVFFFIHSILRKYWAFKGVRINHKFHWLYRYIDLHTCMTKKTV